jgi:hypothetical protein
MGDYKLTSLERRALLALPVSIAGTTISLPTRPPVIHAISRLIEVTSFGARGDGVRHSDGRITLGSDDTAAVQAAIDEALRSGVRSVHFPPGVYCFALGSSPLDPRQGDIDFSGAGANSSILVWEEGEDSDSNDPGYKALLRNTPHEGASLGGLSFSNLQFRGRLCERGAKIGGGGGPAMLLDNYNAITLTGCRFSQMRNMATQCERIGRVEVYGCEFDSVMRDMCRFRSSSSVIIWGNSFRHSDDDAVALHQAEYIQGHGRIHESIIVAHNEFEDVCGIHILGARMTAVTGNVMRRCKVHAVAIAGAKLEGPNPIFGIDISNNQIYDMVPRPPFEINSQVCIYVTPYAPRDGENIYTHGINQNGVDKSLRAIDTPYGSRDADGNQPKALLTKLHAVRITGNIMMRTLPSVSAYSEWGYGPVLACQGWVDPPVSEHSMRPWRALGLPFNGTGMMVKDNYIANSEIALAFSGPAAANNRALTFTIEGNVFYDHTIQCINANHPTPLCVTGRIGTNTFDADPYHLGPQRKAEGAWDIGWPTAISFTHFNGVVIEGNTFRNLSRCVTGTELCDLRSNLIEAQPVGLGAAAGNLGVGVIPPSGTSWRIRVIDANPTSIFFGTLLNLCPEHADACPKEGFFVVGHLVRATIPAEAFGWLRLTTGSGHLMGHDWRLI